MELSQRIVLASSSPWRRQMLLDAGVDCEAVASGLDESTFSAERPEDLALLLAKEKAKLVLVEHPDALVIGADQVAFNEEGSFGKPKNPEDHLERLLSLRGRVHWLTTGVVLMTARRSTQISVNTGIVFRADLSRDELEAYVRSGEGSGCAGGYQIEGRGAWLIERVEGDWLNVVGLPVLEVVSALRTLGWRMGQSPGPVLATTQRGV